MKKLFLLSSLLLSLNAFAENQVTLNVKLTPTGSFQAVSKKVKGKLEKTADGFKADTITVSIESFKTGIDLRDEHFWKHLNSAKTPKATLKNLLAKDGKATADLEVNGVTKPVNITYKTEGSNVKANFKTDAALFSLPKASYLGVGVDNNVEVEVVMEYK